MHRIPFLATVSIIMIMFLHGTSIIKIMIILTINYLIAKLTCSSKKPKALGPILTWVFNISVLYLNEVHSGYEFNRLHRALAILVGFILFKFVPVATYTFMSYLQLC